jgi:flagellar secretion chaperone FliS
MRFSYRQHALASSNPVELVVALYDGVIRFLSDAIVAVEANDVRRRRQSVKRALDIYLHLQSRLRHDVDDKVAATLSQFYTAMFRNTLDASAANSREGFEQVIGQVSQVKEAWRVAARDSEALQALQRGRI